MKIAVLTKLVPDLVDELVIDGDGRALDSTWLRLKLNEFDDHAIEQAILLKERYGAHVTVIIPEGEGADDALFAAAAKGSDAQVKLRGDFGNGISNHALARAYAEILPAYAPDLVLTGVQAHNDLDGALGPLLAGFINLPYIGYVSGIKVEAGKVLALKEYPGRLIAEMEIGTPVILGIQAAERPLSYVAFSKIRQAMKTAAIADRDAPELNPAGAPQVGRLFKPESGERAAMLAGSPDEVAAQLVEIFQEQGVL